MWYCMFCVGCLCLCCMVHNRASLIASISCMLFGQHRMQTCRSRQKLCQQQGCRCRPSQCIIGRTPPMSWGHQFLPDLQQAFSILGPTRHRVRGTTPPLPYVSHGPCVRKTLYPFVCSPATTPVRLRPLAPQQRTPLPCGSLLSE